MWSEHVVWILGLPKELLLVPKEGCFKANAIYLEQVYDMVVLICFDADV